MPATFGREQFAIPGPSVMPDRVLNAMHRPSPNIYEGELIDLTASMLPDLKNVARTAGDVAIYIANGHGAWEAALKNTLLAGDRVLVLNTGRFAAGWAEVAASLGLETEIMEFGMQGVADSQALAERLSQDKDHLIRAVVTVQADTASSALNDIKALRAAIDGTGHPALFMVDCIASLGCDRYEMDEWGADVTVAACQKGLMTPAGLGFVFFGERAREARKRAEPGYYWDWLPRANAEYFYQQFAGTAPTHHLYGLREALDILVHEEGIEKAWARHEVIAQAIWDGLDRWGEKGMIAHNIERRDQRTRAVSAIRTAPGDAARLRQWCEQEAGLTLGIGLGFGEPGSEDWNRHFRIGHMGHQNIVMTMAVLGSVQCGLTVLDIAHGSGGVEAAARRFAKGAV